MKTLFFLINKVQNADKLKAFGSNSNFFIQHSYTCPSQHSYASNEVLVSDDLSITDK